MKWRTVENRKAIRRYYGRYLWNKKVSPYPAPVLVIATIIGAFAGLALFFAIVN